MIGGIYTDEKCPVCGGVFVDNRKDGLICPRHPKVYAQKMSVRFKTTHQRFDNYNQADQFLSALRHDVRNYDARDFKKSSPLGFANLAADWLKTKQSLKSYRHLKRYVRTASEFWGNINIKDIQDAELEDFINSLTVSDKTKHNTISALKTMWGWVWKRNRRTFLRDDFPEFPVISFEMETRKPISKVTQWAILEQAKKMFPIRTYLAIRWLVAHPKVRPGEIITVTEGDVDRDTGTVRIPHPKEKKVKWLYLIEEDIELISSLPLAMPAMPFFRHETGGHGVRIGKAFGKNYLYRRWEEACRAIGVEGVSLYPGTKHSTVTGLNMMGYSPEDIQTNATGHLSPAFKRYLISDVERQREMSRVSLGKELVKKNSPHKKANLLIYEG